MLLPLWHSGIAIPLDLAVRQRFCELRDARFRDLCVLKVEDFQVFAVFEVSKTSPTKVYSAVTCLTLWIYVILSV